jgi:hypothetical protein
MPVVLGMSCTIRDGVKAGAMLNAVVGEELSGECEQLFRNGLTRDRGLYFHSFKTKTAVGVL